MNKVYSILEELNETSGKLDKLAILEKNKDYKLLKDVISATLNPFVRYHVKQIPEYEPSGLLDLAWGLQQLEKLSSREFTGHAGRDHLKAILCSLDKNDADVICRIIKRDLACGVGKGSVEKIWEGLIPEIPKMLAQPMKDKFIAKIKYPAYAQLKSDGARCFAVVSDDGVKLYSRNNLEYNCLDNLHEAIIDFLGDYTDCVLDGELLVVGPDLKAVDRKTGNGIINKATQGTISATEADQVIFSVWDIIPQTDYFKGIYKVKYVDRFKILQDLQDKCTNLRVEVIENTEVNNLAEAKEVFKKYVANGLEGIILKNKAGIWEDKRSNDQVKFKVEIHSDLICTGVYEGEKKYTGMLGGITVKTKDDLLEVDVGSGFNDEQREYYWQNPKEIIGKVVEVKHNGIIKSRSKDKFCVFLPIFQFVRKDKNIKDADTLDSIDG